MFRQYLRAWIRIAQTSVFHPFALISSPPCLAIQCLTNNSALIQEWCQSLLPSKQVWLQFWIKCNSNHKCKRTSRPPPHLIKTLQNLFLKQLRLLHQQSSDKEQLPISPVQISQRWFPTSKRNLYPQKNPVLLQTATPMLCQLRLIWNTWWRAWLPPVTSPKEHLFQIMEMSCPPPHPLASMLCASSPYWVSYRRWTIWIFPATLYSKCYKSSRTQVKLPKRIQILRPRLSNKLILPWKCQKLVTILSELASVLRLLAFRNPRSRVITTNQQQVITRNHSLMRKKVMPRVSSESPTSGMKLSKLRTSKRSALNCSSSASTRAATVSSRRVATWETTSENTPVRDHLSAPGAQRRSLKVAISDATWKTSIAYQDTNFHPNSSTQKLRLVHLT